MKKSIPINILKNCNKFCIIFGFTNKIIYDKIYK